MRIGKRVKLALIPFCESVNSQRVWINTPTDGSVKSMILKPGEEVSIASPDLPMPVCRQVTHFLFVGPYALRVKAVVGCQGQTVFDDEAVGGADLLALSTPVMVTPHEPFSVTIRNQSVDPMEFFFLLLGQYGVPRS